MVRKLDLSQPVYWDGRLLKLEDKEVPDGAWVFADTTLGENFKIVSNNGKVYSENPWLYFENTLEDNFGWPEMEPLPLHNKLNALDVLEGAVEAARKAGFEVYCHVIEKKKTEL
jgi:hypothetical protein